MEYQIKDGINQFLFEIEKAWANLILKTISESIIGAKYVLLFFDFQINGIRFIDKTILGKKHMYRFEVWIHKTVTVEITNKLKEYLKNEFGSEVEEKIIK